MSGSVGSTFLMDQGAEGTIKSISVPRLCFCMLWPDWYQHPPRPHYCYYCTCLHCAHDIWMLISLLSSHACLVSPSGASSLLSPLLPSRLCPTPFSGCTATARVSHHFPNMERSPGSWGASPFWQLGRRRCHHHTSWLKHQLGLMFPWCCWITA